MTTRRLMLIRHAKAADGDVDAQRPLAPRGLRDAAAIGEWLAEHALVPDQVVVSPAVRAVQTWQQAAAALALPPPIAEDPRVYDNSVEALLAVVHDAEPDVRALALVGHNPSMAQLANELDDRAGDRIARAALADGFPTSAVAVFTVGGLWLDVALRAATLTHFSAPRGS